MNRLLMMFLLLVLAGCATNLQQGHRLLAEKKYPKARECYRRALNEQKEQAELPTWDGKGYRYVFDARYAAAAVAGLANTYRGESNRELALYYYFYYVQFCLRNNIDFEKTAGDIRAYIREGDSVDESAWSRKLLESK